MQMKLCALLISVLALIVDSQASRQEEKPLVISIKRQMPPHQVIGNKSYYIEEHNKENWYAAEHKCREMGGHLASLQNENEYQLLKAKLNNQRNYWIDINDLSVEGEYLSATTGLEAKFVKWYPGKNPDNKGGDENCVHLWNFRQSLLMNDARCSYPCYFVCEL